MAKKFRLEKLFINSFLVGNQSQRNSGQMSLRAFESGDDAAPLPEAKSNTPITCPILGPINFDEFHYDFNSNLIGECNINEIYISQPPLICAEHQNASTLPLACLPLVELVDPVLKPITIKHCPPPITIDKGPGIGGELIAGLGGAGGQGGGEGAGDWLWDSVGCDSDNCFTDDVCVSNNTCADCVTNGPECDTAVCPTYVNCESEGFDGICYVPGDSQPPICYLP